MSAKVLKECAEELGFIYQHIFERTIEEHTIPSIWKASIIVPVPKKSNPSVLNDCAIDLNSDEMPGEASPASDHAPYRSEVG